MDVIVGHTGFVGSNLCLHHPFDLLCNSKNIAAAFRTDPSLCVYAGVRAEMFLANANPAADFANIENAIRNIQRINPKKLVLISSVAVFDDTVDVYEDAQINENRLTAYGKNRRYLETWVQENVADHCIIRLPAIYGENLKKNFIYDMIHISPPLLKEAKFKELCEIDDFIKTYYVLQENGFYKCTDTKAVKPYFESIGFSALNFTDSRSIYQFYNLKYLWKHIAFAMKNRMKVFNIATEPVSAAEAYAFVFHKTFDNKVSAAPFHYNIKTRYFDGGYIFDKQQVLADIAAFIKERV